MIGPRYAHTLIIIWRRANACAVVHKNVTKKEFLEHQSSCLGSLTEKTKPIPSLYFVLNCLTFLLLLVSKSYTSLIFWYWYCIFVEIRIWNTKIEIWLRFVELNWIELKTINKEFVLVALDFETFGLKSISFESLPKNYEQNFWIGIRRLIW